MILQKMSDNVEIVQSLSTYPNQEDGLSAEELKAKFDQGPKALKNYLNNVLVPAVQEIQKALAAGEQYGLDTTLQVAGRAADAAAVGRALAEKAPAVESAEFAGCYYRTVAGAVEWLNPPMVEGVEYQTTERYNRQPVYTKLVSCGTLEAGSWKTQEYTGASGAVIRYSGVCGGTAIPFQPFPVADPDNNITLGVIPGMIYISKGSTTTVNGDIYVRVWYVK